MSCHAFRASTARYLFLALLLSTLAMFTPAVEAGGTTYQLSPGDDIQAAINEAVTGDTIQLSMGTYNITTVLDISGKGINVVGETDTVGNPSSILNGGDEVRIFKSSNLEMVDVVLSNLVITGGRGDTEYPYYGSGGGMYCSNTNLEIVNCNFVGNTSRGNGGGGMYLRETNLKMTNCMFSMNTCEDYGSGAGILCLSCDLDLDGCTFTGNVSRGTGGIHARQQTSLSLNDCIFEGNTGSGVYIDDGSSTFADCTFVGNPSQYGGGIRSEYSALTIDRSFFKSNTATSYGGGIFLRYGNEDDDVAFTMTECLFCENSGLNGTNR